MAVEAKKKLYAFFQGDFVPLEEARISILNHAFRYGSAVFEGIRTYWNEKQEQSYIIRQREHFERMFDSMKIMYLETKYSVDELCEIVVELLRMNNARTNTYVRVSLYKSGDFFGPVLVNNPSELAISDHPVGDYFHGATELKCVVSSWRRVEDNAIPVRAKIVGAYANIALAKSDAMVAGFDDCIVLSENGHVSEASAANIFLIKKGELITPPGPENILEGITRRSVMEFAEREFNLKTNFRCVDRSELYIADEAFLCGTGSQIAPVVEIDRRPIGSGKTGPLTKKIMDMYVSICRGEKPEYGNWLTPVYPTKK